MKVYILDIDEIPDSYHGGWAVVVAVTDGQVEQLLREHDIELSSLALENATVYPTHSYIEPAVHIFPIGCC